MSSIGRMISPAKIATPIPDRIGGFDRQVGQTNWPGGRAPAPAPMPSIVPAPGGPMFGQQNQAQAAMERNQVQMNNQVAASTGPQIPLGYGR